MIAPDARPVSGRVGLDRLAETVAGAAATTTACRRASRCRGMPASCCSAISSRRSRRSSETVGRLAAIPVTGHLLQILDPAEADLPYNGRVRFRGLEREGDTLIPRVEGVRDAYGRRLKAQQEGLAAICAAAGFGFRDPPHRPLAGGRPARRSTRALGRAMIFAAPWVLLALAALPLLWWLLRVTPPAPRSEIFPAIRLLIGLNAREETPARTPWWLLLLRVLAAALVILALARPVLDAGAGLAGYGSGAAGDRQWLGRRPRDWARRMEAANAMLDRAERAGRNVALLVTAADAHRRGAADHPADAGRRPARHAWRRCSRSRGRRTAPPPRPRCAGWQRRHGGRSISPTG